MSPAQTIPDGGAVHPAPGERALLAPAPGGTVVVNPASPPTVGHMLATALMAGVMAFVGSLVAQSRGTTPAPAPAPAPAVVADPAKPSPAPRPAPDPGYQPVPLATSAVEVRHSGTVSLDWGGNPAPPAPSPPPVPTPTPDPPPAPAAKRPVRVLMVWDDKDDSPAVAAIRDSTTIGAALDRLRAYWLTCPKADPTWLGLLKNPRGAEMRRAADASGYPVAFVLDADGVVLATLIVPPAEADLVAKVAKVIGGAD